MVSSMRCQRLCRGWLLLLIAAWFATARPAEARDPSAASPLLQQASDLLDEVAPADTSYQHKGGEVHWAAKGSDKSAECHTDCSGLIDALFKRTYGLTRDEFSEWMKVKRPLAKNYHTAIIEHHGFKQIDSVGDALPGDLLAIAYPPGEENTGHVMLVAGKPRQREATPPEVENTQQWEIAVIDVSRSGHGPTDTRMHTDKNSEEKHSGQGLGRGIFRIYTDSQGHVAGYSWSSAKGSKFVEQSVHHLVIGRVQPEFIEALKKSAQ